MRAIPGSYTVRLTAGGVVLEQQVTVRVDPRVRTTPDDWQAWQREARTIERTECTLRRAVASLAVVERQLADAQSRATGAPARDEIARLGRELRPVVLALRGDPTDPGHVNLPGRVNWLTIQVGNNSGRPTAAQAEWIAIYAKQTAEVVSTLNALLARARALG